MARFGFAAIVAMLLGVGLAIWVAPTPAPGPAAGLEDAPELPEPAPRSTETSEITGAPATVSQGAPTREPAPAAEAAIVPNPATPEPPVIGVPTLPEEQREIAAASAFDLEAEAGAESEAALEPPASAAAANPERSGDLIRRMLAVYRQMGE